MSKIKPEIYAKSLIESAKPDNLKVVAKNLWHLLQKNKQYKDLSCIVESLDTEYAKSQKMILAKVYSEKALTEVELTSIKQKLTKKINKDIIIKNILKQNLVGFVVKVDDNVIDLSINGKVEDLKKLLASRSNS